MSTNIQQNEFLRLASFVFRSRENRKCEQTRKDWFISFSKLVFHDEHKSILFFESRGKGANVNVDCKNTRTFFFNLTRKKKTWMRKKLRNCERTVPRHFPSLSLSLSVCVLFSFLILQLVPSVCMFFLNELMTTIAKNSIWWERMRERRSSTRETKSRTLSLDKWSLLHTHKLRREKTPENIHLLVFVWAHVSLSLSRLSLFLLLYRFHEAKKKIVETDRTKCVSCVEKSTR